MKTLPPETWASSMDVAGGVPGAGTTGFTPWASHGPAVAAAASD